MSLFLKHFTDLNQWYFQAFTQFDNKQILYLVESKYWNYKNVKIYFLLCQVWKISTGWNFLPLNYQKSKTIFKSSLNSCVYWQTLYTNVCLYAGHRVTHKEWDFKDDCTESVFIPQLSSLQLTVFFYQPIKTV